MAITTQQLQNDDDHSQLPHAPAQIPETTLAPSPHVEQLDEQLDFEEHSLPEDNSPQTSKIAMTASLTPPSSPHTHATLKESSVPIIDDDELFDSDEKVDVESIASSSSGRADPPSTPRISDASTATDATNPSAVPPRKEPSTASGLGLLTRASMTFYKAFKKSTKKPTSEPSSVSQGSDSPNPESAQSRADALHRTHARLVHLLDAQIATLNGAKTGFVDLQLLKPMTQKTLDAVQHDAQMLLTDYGQLEERAAELEKQTAQAEKAADEELAAKEQMLITAKVRLAEASCEVDGLKHELRMLQKEVNRPDRVAARQKSISDRENESLRLEAVASRDARVAAQERLSTWTKNVERERGELHRLDESYRDIEGDWA